jgi:hypothetical protein
MRGKKVMITAAATGAAVIGAADWSFASDKVSDTASVGSRRPRP